MIINLSNNLRTAQKKNQITIPFFLFKGQFLAGLEGQNYSVELSPFVAHGHTEKSVFPFGGFVCQFLVCSSAPPVSHLADIILLSTNKGTFVFSADFFSSLDCPALNFVILQCRERNSNSALCLPLAILNSIPAFNLALRHTVPHYSSSVHLYSLSALQ